MSGCVTTVPTVVDVGETRTETETNRKESRYELEHDTGPARPVNVDHIAEPVPRVEPRTAAGNKSPYTIKGRTYRVMGSPEGYKERGVASWYGKKFHGKATSNGELYDMYAMTAAHKTLPIPSYVRVTNVANKKSVIVRVNDRGPFHDNRIIDLSYSAAKKVGVQAKGTGEVMVEYIDPRSYSGSANTGSDTADSGTGERAPTPQNPAGYAIPKNTFLQVGAFGEKGSAMALRSKLLPHTQYPVLVLQPQRGARPLYRVRIGPLKNNLDLMYLKQRLKQNAFPDPHVVQH
ncbi:MAG: septal ring lytic transglycosylase RlpA family protein [Cellvibrionaceae bacterium]|nr:septal ring lytic transglycosylase RlpA family protein [Cellvibrionaceae bacterium]